MAETFHFTGGSEISLDQYIDYIKTSVDVHDIDSLRESAYNLYRLSFNKTILTDILYNEAISINEEVQVDNQYADQSFLIHREDEFFIRANIWTPPSKSIWRQSDKPEFNYETSHDHNYDFLTVGYYGPGYTTRIYKYDYNKCSDLIGDRVDLEFLEETTLPQHKVMLYRQSEDIHTQLHPPSLSISLNLMITSKSIRTNRQVELDPEGYISSLIAPYLLRQTNVIKMCGLLGNSETLPILEQICHESDQSMLVSESLKSISTIDMIQSRFIAEKLVNSDSRLIAETARQILEA